MDDQRFDSLVRSLASGRDRRQVLRGLLGSAALIGVGTTSATAGNKVDICHRTGNGAFQILSVSENALDAHLAHGDSLPIDGHCFRPCTDTSECGCGQCVDHLGTGSALCMFWVAGFCAVHEDCEVWPGSPAGFCHPIGETNYCLLAC